MKDMLAKIIEIDKNAQKIMDEAQQTKVSSAEEINAKKKQLKQDFLLKARKQIEQNRAEEEEKLRLEAEKISGDKEEKIKAMWRIYDENCDKWVNEIVKMTVEG